MWWFTHVILSTQEAKLNWQMDRRTDGQTEGGSGQAGLESDTLSFPKNKQKERNQQERRKEKDKTTQLFSQHFLSHFSFVMEGEGLG